MPASPPENLSTAGCGTAISGFLYTSFTNCSPQTGQNPVSLEHKEAASRKVPRRDNSSLSNRHSSISPLFSLFLSRKAAGSACRRLFASSARGEQEAAAQRVCQIEPACCCFAFKPDIGKRAVYGYDTAHAVFFMPDDAPRPERLRVRRCLCCGRCSRRLPDFRAALLKQHLSRTHEPVTVRKCKEHLVFALRQNASLAVRFVAITQTTGVFRTMAAKSSFARTGTGR